MIIGIEAAAAALRNAPAGNGGNGGGGAVTGVRFDNSSVASGLTVASQSVTDSPLLTISMWFRSTDVSFWPSLVGLAKYPVANYSNVVIGLNNEGDIGGGFKTLNGAKLLEFSTAGSIVGSNETHHLFISADTNHAAAAKLINVLLDGASQELTYLMDVDSAFNIAMNGFPFGLPDFSVNLGTGFIMDYAEVWIALGQYVAPADVTKFRDISGNPVDLGSDGSTPTGIAPTYYFKGDNSTFGTNAGSGPTVTVTGSIGNTSL